MILIKMVNFVKCFGIRAYKFGGTILLKANGHPIQSNQDLSIVEEEALVLERSLILTLILVNGADLSQVDRTKFARRGQSNPCHHHGEPTAQPPTFPVVTSLNRYVC